MRLGHDRHGPAGKEVDGGRGEQRQLLGPQAALERLVGAGERHPELELLARLRADRRLQVPQLHEQEARRAGEIFAQQPVAGEAGRCRREQGLIVGEADRRQALAAQHLRPAARPERHAVAEERLVEPVGEPVVAREVEDEPVERQRPERQAALRLEGQLERRLGRRRQADAGVGHLRPGQVLEPRDGDRPQGHRVGGREGAAGLLGEAETAHQLGAALDREPVLEAAGGRVGLEPDQGDRRRGGEIVGVDHLEQAGREALELAVQLLLDARGQEGAAVEQPLDVGVGAGVGLEPEPARHPRVLARELVREVAQEAQLGLVVAEEAPVHQRPPPAATGSGRVARPSSRSSTVRR